MFRWAILAVFAVLSELWYRLQRWLDPFGDLILDRSYADELPAHLYPTDDLPPEQTSNYVLLLKLIADSGLQIKFSFMYTETHATGNNESYHYFQIYARCNKTMRVLKMTKRGNLDHIYVMRQFEVGSTGTRKTLYISEARPEHKIYNLVNIFTEEDTRKWRFKTFGKLQKRIQKEQRRAQQKRLLAVMLASHPRLGEAAPMHMLVDDLFQIIARLSLS